MYNVSLTGGVATEPDEEAGVREVDSRLRSATAFCLTSGGGLRGVEDEELDASGFLLSRPFPLLSSVTFALFSNVVLRFAGSGIETCASRSLRDSSRSFSSARIH